ncbi:unnamed protein product, partial [Staurois parvus]
KKDEKKDEKKEKDEKVRTRFKTAVCSECPRTVINSLFLIDLGHSLHTAVLTAVMEGMSWNCQK